VNFEPITDYKLNVWAKTVLPKTPTQVYCVTVAIKKDENKRELFSEMPKLQNENNIISGGK